MGDVDLRWGPPAPSPFASDAELRALYTALPVGVAFLSPDLRYQRVNATLAALNGRPVEDHIGAPIDEILGERAEAIRPLLAEVMEQRTTRELAIEIPRPGRPGDIVALEATYFPVLGEARELLGVGGVVREVTDRREAELEQSRLLRDALVARAQAEAAQVHTDQAREDAENARATAELARSEAERGRARLGIIARAGRTMAESLDWETTLRAVSRTAVPELADWSALTVVEPDGQHRVVGVAHADPERERLAWALVERYGTDPRADTPTAWVIRRGEPAVTADIPHDTLRAAARDDEQLELLLRLGTRHSAIIPLRSAGGITGALVFVRGDARPAFSTEDVEP